MSAWTRAAAGRVLPVHVVPGGLWLLDETGAPKNLPCALRLVRRREVTRCQDIARQYLASRGDGNVGMLALTDLTNLLTLHLSLVQPRNAEAMSWQRLLFMRPPISMRLDQFTSTWDSVSRSRVRLRFVLVN